MADTAQGGTKDTMITGLVGDGTVLPPFIATDVFDPPIEEEYKSYMPEDKAQSVNVMIKYLDWLHARGYPTEDEVVLLVDRGPGANKGQSQELNEEYHGWFDHHGIKYALYPVEAGSIQSPNDVHFHSQLKLQLHKALENKINFNSEEKMKAAI